MKYQKYKTAEYYDWNWTQWQTAEEPQYQYCFI